MSFLDKMSEKIPLIATAADYDAQQRAKHYRNILFGIGLASVAALVVVLTVSLSPSKIHGSLTSSATDESNLLQSGLVEGKFGDEKQNGSVRKSPIVRIKQGQLQGRVLKSRKGRDYYAFNSIPYGKPPINENRFELAQPAEAWKERVYDATAVKTRCPSKDRTRENAMLGCEDCLHLHIATPILPNRRSRQNLPVLVYIFGGAFTNGRASSYDPKYFMDEDVILVFMDFRLGVFGHLNTGDGVVNGNLSLKDQSLALKWIRDNIKAFGGDPKRVVIFGNSSGSISVHAHLLSEMSRGLFQGAISESGVSLGPNFPNAVLEHPGVIARSFGKQMNCSEPEDSVKLVKCLKEADPLDLVTVDSTWTLTGETVPASGDTSQMFLTDKPINLMRNGQVTKVPWIVGVNSAEKFPEAYELVKDQQAVDALNKDWAAVVLGELHLPTDDEGLKEEIRQLYFNGTETFTKEDRYGLTNALSDRTYYHPSRLAGMLHSEQSPVYFYYLTRESNYTLREESKVGFEPPYGVGHADEQQYLFWYYGRYPEIKENDSRMQFSEEMIKIWVSFARDLAPDPMGVEPWNPIQDSQDGLIWFQIDEKSLRKNIEPFTERMKFWDNIDSKLNIYG